MPEGSVLSSARCSGGLPPLHEAYENGIGDLKLGRRAVTTNLAAPTAPRSRMVPLSTRCLGVQYSESSSQPYHTHPLGTLSTVLEQAGR